MSKTRQGSLQHFHCSAIKMSHQNFDNCYLGRFVENKKQQKRRVD